MANDIQEVEKIIRFMIEMNVIHIFNKEDDIIKYLKELYDYKWPKGAILECHRVAVMFCGRILLPDEFLYFSYFKWIVLWLKIKKIYLFRDDEKIKNEMLQEFLTVKELLKNGNVTRSGHQWANPLSEIYHIYAHYPDTRNSLCYQNEFNDLRLEYSFLQGIKGSVHKKLKNQSIVERCFTYYLHNLTDLLFIKRNEDAETDKVNTEVYENKKYLFHDIMGIRYRYRNRGKWSPWRVATMFRKGN